MALTIINLFILNSQIPHSLKHKDDKSGEAARAKIMVLL